MEKFKIYIDDDEFYVKTPLLKGDGNFEFNIFQKNNLLGTVRPQLTRNRRLTWASSSSNVMDKKAAQAIGRAILEHYSNNGY